MIGKTNATSGAKIDILDLTATAEDVTSGKIAYTVEGKVTGTNIDSTNYKDLLAGTMENFIAPTDLKTIGGWCFRGVPLSSAYLSHGITNINNGAFYAVATLKDLFLPNTLSYTQPSTNPFSGCSGLRNVTFEDDFNCNNLDLSISTNYSSDTILAMLEALADRTGKTTYTLTLGTTNLNKMAEEEIAVATEKNGL